MNFLKKISAQVKNIQHIIDNKKLHMDLELQVAKIRDKNYKKIMDELTSCVSASEERKSGLLLTPREARERAEALYIVGRMTGVVDALNQKVK